MTSGYDIDEILKEFLSEPEHIPTEENPITAKSPTPKQVKKAPAPKQVKKTPAPKRVKKTSPPKQKPTSRIGNGFLCVLFALLSALCIGWLGFNLHPFSSSAPICANENNHDIAASLDTYINNHASDTFGDLTYIKKLYSIPEAALAGPVPDEACFGSTENPEDIAAILEQAAELIGDQKMSWNPDAYFYPGDKIRYYLDETILVLAWREAIDGTVYSCAEVKIADASQLRRKISDDSYGSSVQLYGSTMAQQANAVVAINGDFYAFRNLGITAYQRTLYRNKPDILDSCLFTASGDMIFSYAGENTGEGEAQNFIDENDVLFAVSFGPVLVDNGVKREIDYYPIGEIDDEYSRSAIGQIDDLHYFLMTANFANGFNKVITIHQAAQVMWDKNCQRAYALDGGQTAEIIMHGELINHVDYGNERLVSDIIYFATALPNEEAR